MPATAATPEQLDELQEKYRETLAEQKALTDTVKEKSGGLFGDDDLKKFNELDALAEQFEQDIHQVSVSLSATDRFKKRKRFVETLGSLFANDPTPDRLTSHDSLGNAPNGGDEPKLWKSLGEQLSAIYEAGNPMGGHRVDERLTMLAPTGSSEGSPSDGGFLVQQDFSTEILKKMYDVGQLLSRVRRIPVSSSANGLKINAIDETSRATGSRLGGIRVYRKAEGDQGTGSKPKLRQIELTLKKLFGMWYATDELLADQTALGSVAQDGFAEEFSFANENELINGDGAAEMQGILGCSALVSVAAETGQAAATIVKENIDKMWSRMWSRSMQNAVWLVNQDVFPQLFQLSQTTGTAGVPVWMPPGGISGSPFSTIYGRPVIPVEYCPTLGTVGDIMFVDLSQYVMIEKGGLQSDQSMHLRFDYGETAFRWIMRNDGKPTWRSALTPFKGSNALSPYVALATRS